MGRAAKGELGASPKTRRARVPVLIVAWNRPQFLQSVLADVLRYAPPKIYLHIDGPPQSADRERIIELHREILKVFREKTQHLPTEIRIQQANLGCGYGPSAAVDWFFQNESEGIIIEDDIQVSLKGLELLTIALDMFRDSESIASVSACNIVSGRRGPRREENIAFVLSSIPNSSGWATWSDRWADHLQEASELLWRVKWLRIAQQLGATATLCLFYWLAREAWRQNRGTSTMWDAQWMLANVSRGRDFLILNHNQVVNLDLYSGTHPLPVPLELAHENVPDNLMLKPHYCAARDRNILTYYLRFNARGVLLRLTSHLRQTLLSTLSKEVRGRR